MGNYSLLTKWFLSLIAANYVCCRYINNFAGFPLPNQANLGFSPYQSYPMMPFTNSYQPIPWLSPYLSYGLPNQQMLYPSNQSGLFGSGNYPTIGDINTEIIDVDPAYHRMLLGLDAGNNQVSITSRKPRFRVQVDSKSYNITNAPTDMKPIIYQKSYSSTIRKSFVIDPSNATKIEPINIHYLNGVEVTTPPPKITTEDESVAPINRWIGNNKFKRT